MTAWHKVLIALIAGCAVAFQIGKIPAALPLLIAEFDLNLFWAGTIVSTLSVLTGTVGLLIGSLADRIGHRRAAVSGLLICAAAGLLGSWAESLTALLAGRMIEGLGFILAVVSLPPLIVAASSTHDRPITLGLWGAFLPAGMSFMLLLSPWLALDLGLGWRGLWSITAGLILLCSGILWWTFRMSVATHTVAPPAAARLTALWHTVTQPGPLRLAGCFIAYSAQFLAITSFLPTLLLATQTVTVNRAAALGALVVAVNVIGNIAAGWLLRHGSHRRTLLLLAHLSMGLCSLLIFSEALPLTLRISAAIAFTGSGGLIPGTLFASVPDYARHPNQNAGLNGFLIQGAGIGQIIGPLLLTATVSGFGTWAYAPVFTLTAAAAGMLCAAGLRNDASGCCTQSNSKGG